MSGTLANGRHDAGARRKALRKQREKGCSIYIPAEALAKAGYDPDGEVPYYRVWGSSRGGLFIRLYTEQ